MESSSVIIAVPSKGRLKEQAAELFERAGLGLRARGHERGYRGRLEGLDDVEVEYTSASEIVHQLKAGRVHLGITGEDLVREMLADVDAKVEFLKPLGFGQADVVVAVPDCWLDVSRMADLEVNIGVVVDNHMRTTRPDILAAGDVCEHNGVCYGI